MPKGIGPLIAGVTGAALGAAAGVALSNKKTRQRLAKAARGVTEQGESVYHQIRPETKKGRRAHKSG